MKDLEINLKQKGNLLKEFAEKNGLDLKDLGLAEINSDNLNGFPKILN